MNYNSAESWQTARDYEALLGDVPNSFSTTVRTLVQDHEKRNGTLSPATRFLVLRLLKGGSIKSPLYFAALAFADDKIINKDYVSSEELLKIFSPIDMAALLGYIYMYRKAKRLCEGDEWENLAKPLHKLQEVGGLTGFAIPAIGGGMGLFAAAMPQLAFAVFLKHDKKGYVEYRRHLKNNNAQVDFEFEMKRWGCTSVQIGSVMIQAIGMGIPLATSFTLGLSPDSKVDKSADKVAFSFKVARMWIDSLYTSGEIPNITHDGAYYPAQDARERLVEKVRLCMKDDGRVCWLDKGKDDISPELTPQLFQGGATAAAAAESDEGDKMSNQFSADELKDMTTQIQDILKE